MPILVDSTMSKSAGMGAYHYATLFTVGNYGVRKLSRLGSLIMKKGKKHLYLCVSCLILFAASLMPSACGPSSKPIEASGFYFDTVIRITLYDSSRQDALNHCMELAERYERYFSATLPDSDISRINVNPNRPVKVHKETAELIQKGLDYGRLSDGQFDITIGKVSSLWDFHTEGIHTLPKTSSIKKSLKHVDYRQVHVSGNTVTLQDPDSAIDVGGIAKGYIADRMKVYLKKEGITAGLINLGGNVLTLGEKPDHKPYTIGIQKPFSDDGTPALTLKIRNRSVVTSGTYQRYFLHKDNLYHHILDTSTGYPCQNDLNSVTIISKSSTDGDALSTMVFLMGLKKGMQFVESKDNIEAVFITKDGQIHYSAGFGIKIPFKEY